MEAQCRYGERRGSPTAAGDGRWLRIHRPKNPGASTLKRGAAVRVNPIVMRPDHKSSGAKPVRLAIRLSIRGPISVPS
jgi:hypothetical protein